MQESIITLVFLNNVANIAGSIIIGTIAGTLFNEFWLGVFSGGFTFVIILVGEIVPKTIGEQHAESYARHTAGLVRILRIVFFPAVVLVRQLVRPFSINDEAGDGTAEEEINILARLGHKHGDILESETQLIKRTFELNDISAREIMTPRTVVFALQADRVLSDIAQDLYKTSFSRIPVFETDLDEVIGVVHIRDLLAALAKGLGSKTVREFADPVSFIPDTARADALLKSFQRNREHLSIVVDEYGGMAGVLSLEDILEQLVGEIVDEFDKDVDMRMKARTMREKR
jgi:CBS domain containing-hemolysin-like protein